MPRMLNGLHLRINQTTILIEMISVRNTIAAMTYVDIWRRGVLPMWRSNSTICATRIYVTQRHMVRKPKMKGANLQGSVAWHVGGQRFAAGIAQ